MKIFVISLADSSARRKSAAAQFRKFGIEFTFFPAISGNNAIDSNFDSYNEDLFFRNTGRTACAGEIGCYASHLALWKQCIESGEPIVIMEDDFLLLEGFPKALQQANRNVDQYGYIRLQTETRAGKHKEKECGDFTLWRYTKAPHSAMCYAISPTVAAAFAEHSNILTAPIDVYVKRFWEHKQPMYGLTPYTVAESDLAWNTNIMGREKSRKPLKVELLRVITKLNWFFGRLRFNFSQNYLKHNNSH